MGIFSFKDKMFSKWSMRWKNVKYSKQSGAMKELLDKPAVAKALDRWDEQKELYDLLRSKADGGVTRQEMRQILGKLRRGGGKSIDRTEAMKIAHAIFPGRFADRYDFSETRDQGDVAQTSDISDHSAPAVESPSVVSSRHSSVGRRRLSSGTTPSCSCSNGRISQEVRTAVACSAGSDFSATDVEASPEFLSDTFWRFQCEGGRTYCTSDSHYHEWVLVVWYAKHPRSIEVK